MRHGSGDEQKAGHAEQTQKRANKPVAFRAYAGSRVGSIANLNQRISRNGIEALVESQRKESKDMRVISIDLNAITVRTHNSVVKHLPGLVWLLSVEGLTTCPHCRIVYPAGNGKGYHLHGCLYGC